MPPVLTPQQQSQYFASEGPKANPLSPLAWLALQNASNLSGTGQASPGAAPMANATPNAGGGTSAPASPSSTSASPSPAPSSTGNPLIDFSNALKTATEMAAQKRAALGTALIMPFQGQNPSSDFNSIFANLKAAGDTTSQDLIKTATDAYTKSQPTYKTETIGGDLYQVQIDPNSGQVMGTPSIVLRNPQPTHSGGGINSGTLDYTNQDKAEDSKKLEATRSQPGSDGYVNPVTYQTLFTAWIGHGGTAAGFLSTFPPKDYVNPANTWLPSFLRPNLTGTSAMEAAINAAVDGTAQ